MIYGHKPSKIGICLKNWPINMSIDPKTLQLVGLFYNYLSSPFFLNLKKILNFEYLYLKNYWS